MVPPDPPIRYYRAGASGRTAAIVVAVVLGVLAIGAGAAWGVGLLDRSDGSNVVGLGTTPADLGEGSTPAAGTVQIGAGVDRNIDATSLGMVGDSITVGSTAAIKYVLTAEGFDQFDINAETSRRIEEGDGTGSPLSGIKALYGMLADGVDPDVWVIALGTNDVGQYDDPAEYRRLVTAMVDMIPDGKPLVWVDVYRFDHLDATDEYNAILRDVVEARSDSIVVSWFDKVTAPGGSELLRDDHVHPNDDGTAVFAGLVADGIDAVA